MVSVRGLQPKGRKAIQQWRVPVVPPMLEFMVCFTAQRREKPVISPSTETGSASDGTCLGIGQYKGAGRMRERRLTSAKVEELEQPLRNSRRFMSRETDYSVLVSK